MSWDGSSIERVSTEKGTKTPIWAPDGQSLLYAIHTENGNEFHIVSLAGKMLKKIPVPARMTSVGSPSWFPDGSGIVFAGRIEEPRGSYDIYHLKFGAEEPALKQIVSDGIQPAWWKKGGLLAFTTFRDGNLEVYVTDSEGKTLRNLTQHEGYDGRASWCPDGRIAFESDRFGDLEICKLEIATGEVVNITNHPGKDRHPSCGPDGKIAFVSDRDGKSSIYSMGVGGTNLIKLTPGYDDDWEPAWSPDGLSICFVSNRSEPFLKPFLNGLIRWF